MIRPILVAGSIAFALAAMPAAGQQTPAPDPPSAQQPDQSLVGLAVYSSDGHKVGEVAEVGMAGGVPVVRAEMGEFLGLGSSSVIILAKAFQRKADRIEVSMTADEIKETISKQRQKQQEQQKQQ